MKLSKAQEVSNHLVHLLDLCSKREAVVNGCSIFVIGVRGRFNTNPSRSPRK